jgi:hypothetical protein
LAGGNGGGLLPPTPSRTVCGWIAAEARPAAEKLPELVAAAAQMS